MLGVNLAKARVGDMRVYLCRLDRRVTKHGLDTANVSAVHQEISRIRMSERVRSDVFGDTGGASIVINETLNGPRCQRL